MLGEFYNPSGLALETAKAVLECEFPLACNVAIGCSNACSCCYGPLSCKKSEEEWLKVRQPNKTPKELVQLQWQKLTDKNPLASLREHDLFLSFFTDPFLPINRANTEELIKYWLFMSHTKVATLSKMGISEMDISNLRSGLSIVSLDEQFRKAYEPNTLPYKNRLRALFMASIRGYSWASLEPYPCYDIWPQRIEPLLEELKFCGVNLIVFGKWNYDKRASTEAARLDYRKNVEILTDFCNSNNIRLHIKSDTLKFIQTDDNKESLSTQEVKKP
jgi:DNA repair photolyase